MTPTIEAIEGFCRPQQPPASTVSGLCCGRIAKGENRKSRFPLKSGRFSTAVVLRQYAGSLRGR
eukprot:scaffold12911_cov35-Tisochrysis_lutea.AAC.1